MKLDAAEAGRLARWWNGIAWEWRQTLRRHPYSRRALKSLERAEGKVQEYAELSVSLSA